jgi:hypothetical protein
MFQLGEPRAVGAATLLQVFQHPELMVEMAVQAEAVEAVLPTQALQAQAAME